VAELKTYRAEVDRDGKVWRIRVPEVARTTQARTLREVEPMVRDLIAIMDNIPAGSFGVDVILTLPADVQAELDRSAELRDQAARSQAQAAQLARRAARRLRDQGLPLQDVGKALGVSFQRAKQLIDEADKLASLPGGHRKQWSRSRGRVMNRARSRLWPHKTGIRARAESVQLRTILRSGCDRSRVRTWTSEADGFTSLTVTA